MVLCPFRPNTARGFLLLKLRLFSLLSPGTLGNVVYQVDSALNVKSPKIISVMIELKTVFFYFWLSAFTVLLLFCLLIGFIYLFILFIHVFTYLFSLVILSSCCLSAHSQKWQFNVYCCSLTLIKRTYLCTLHTCRTMLFLSRGKKLHLSSSVWNELQCKSLFPSSALKRSPAVKWRSPAGERWAAGAAGRTPWSLATWRAGPKRRSQRGWPAPTPTSPCRPSRASPPRTPRPALLLRKQSARVRRMN